MPVDGLLQYMHFKVEWNDKDNAVCLIMNGHSDQGNTEIIRDSCNNDSDAKAIENIQKTEIGDMLRKMRWHYET